MKSTSNKYIAKQSVKAISDANRREAIRTRLSTIGTKIKLGEMVGTVTNFDQSEKIVTLSANGEEYQNYLKDLLEAIETETIEFVD